MPRKRNRNLKWAKLDNTANLFPVIAREGISNVYRVSCVLNEDIKEELLQEALDTVLPYFDIFHSYMKKGVFWYYFETNDKKPPRVREEKLYPCMYINQYGNRDYLFRVSYYKNRINLEVFHALTDGNGGLAFLKEIVYQYLRLAHSELEKSTSGILAPETSLNQEDSYLRNYKKKAKKTYKTQRAVMIKGSRLPVNEVGVIHGYIDIAGLKRASKERGLTINQFLVGAYAWAIYKSHLKSMPSKRPVVISVPVNLRPYFDSDTNKNFFVVVSAVFHPKKEEYTFEEVLSIIADSLKEQITKENLEKLFSYNVSNEMNIWLRAIPLFIKQFAIRYVYNASAKANTTTLTNLGVQSAAEEYKPYIQNFYAILAQSKGQNIKATVCSYGEKLTLSFCANFRETNIQKAFFRTLTDCGIPVEIETNGVYYE